MRPGDQVVKRGLIITVAYPSSLGVGTLGNRVVFNGSANPVVYQGGRVVYNG